jgi:hypothetical protein
MASNRVLDIVRSRDLLTNATVVDDAIRFVSQKSKDQENIKSPIEGDKESREPDYDDVEQLEEEQETVATAASTINQVF